MSPFIGSALYLVLFLLVLHLVDRLAARVPEESSGGGETKAGGGA